MSIYLVSSLKNSQYNINFYSLNRKNLRNYTLVILHKLVVIIDKNPPQVQSPTSSTTSISPPIYNSLQTYDIEFLQMDMWLIDIHINVATTILYKTILTYKPHCYYFINNKTP
jgi:hypothetical protein